MKRLLIPVLLMCLVSCSPIGPGTIARDRFDYSTNIAQSWQRQMLLNMVKLRYADTPIFMDVASVINQYSLEGTVDVSATFQTPDTDKAVIGGTGKYYDRPTITYMPMVGEKFTRNLMTPIPPGSIMALVQAGWPIDFVFWLNVKSINGIRNRSSAQLFAHPGDPDFILLLQAMRRIQASGAIGLRVKKIENGHEAVMIIRKEVEEDLTEEREFIQETLGISPEVNELRLVFGLLPSDDREIAMLTRSMLEILVEMAFGIDIPAEHIAENRASPAPSFSQKDSDLPRLICVKSSPGRPDDAFVAVPYRDHWFWIDDRDLNSKRMFTFLMILFSLAETGGDGDAPIVTIPAG